MYTDASSDAIGIALGQIQNGKEVAIAYGGRDLSKAERKYSATEREALAIVDAIKHYQPYLYGRCCVIHTDHHALKWLMNIKEPTGRLAQWSLLIQQYDFEIRHRAGKSNGNANGLSRRPYGNCSLNALDSPGVQTDKIYHMQRRDTELVAIILYLTDGTLPESNIAARSILLTSDMFYIGEDSLLYHLQHTRKSGPEGPFSQLVVPSNLKYEILMRCHDDVTAGHFGVHKTYEKIRERYWWKGMFKDCEHWCKSCIDCQTKKTPRNRHKAPLLSMPVESAFDALGPFRPTHSGNKYIIVFTDYLTKWVEAFPVESIAAPVVARLLVDEIISRHGAPRVLLSDRGSNFLSNLVKEVCTLFRIWKVNTTAYHPQCDGLVERFNSTIATTLSMFVSRDQKDWDIHIPSVLFAYRVSISESTGDSPFFLLFGRSPRLPLDTSLIAPTDLSSSIAEHRKRIVQQIERAQNLARENNQRAQQKMKAYYDKTARMPSFEIGQRVWVYTPRVKRGLSKKLAHLWFGPYRIIDKMSPVHFRLRTEENRKVTTMVHANRMKLFIDPNDRPIEPPDEDDTNDPYLNIEDLPDHILEEQARIDANQRQTNPNTREKQEEATAPQSTNQTEQVPNPLIDNQEVFSAQKLLKSRKVNGKIEYLVKWDNYHISEATWEPEANILDQRLLAQFEKAQHKRNVAKAAKRRKLNNK